MKDIPVYKFRYPDGKLFPFEIFRIETHPVFNREVPRPRRDKFYALFWITGGTGQYFIDFQDYAIQPNTLFLIAPGQVHYWKSNQVINGLDIPFKDELFLKVGNWEFLDKLDLFEMVGSAYAVKFPDGEAQRINNLFEDILSEYTSELFGRGDVIVSLLKLILIYAQRRVMSPADEAQLSAGQQLVRQYLVLHKSGVTAEQHLESYADQLGVTAGYLTEVVKEATGVPAGTLMRQRLVLEVKRLLVHTDLTSAQVAEKMHFNDPSYFNRFFKRETGQIPRAFRDNFRQNM